MLKSMRKTYKELLGSSRSKWALRYLFVVVLVALIGDFLANDKPLYCKKDGVHYLPIIKSYLVKSGLDSWSPEMINFDWSKGTYENVLRAPIPYSPQMLDLQNANFVGPFNAQQIKAWNFRHWLGTDDLGRDVSAGMIRGCRIALVVGFLSMLFAGIVGVPIGAASGYLGDDRVRMPIHQFFIASLVLLLILFGIFQLISGLSLGQTWRYVWLFLIFCCVVTAVSLLIMKLIDLFQLKTRTLNIPVDFITLRVIEIFRAIPAFFLLFAILGIIQQSSIWFIVLLIALLRWPVVARYTRAEALKVRQMSYIESARAIGLSDREILFRHVIPNSLSSVLIVLAFGVAIAVLLESGLSFLGIGLPLEEVSWGKMLNAARKNFSAWWLAVFPGTAIFFTIYALNVIARELNRILNPIQKIQQQL
jgi:peptide/nickel transport system permease protein